MNLMMVMKGRMTNRPVSEAIAPLVTSFRLGIASELGIGNLHNSGEQNSEDLFPRQSNNMTCSKAR
jgi:hypothetical protein